MKEKIIFFILGLVLLFVPGINSHAENENPIYPEDNPVDDSIFEDDDLLYDNGYAFFFIRERDNFNGATTRTYYKANIEVSEGFKPFYVRSTDYSLESRYQLIVRKNSVSTKKDLVNDKGGKISFNGSWKWFNPDSKEVYNGGELTDVYEKEQPYAMFFSGQDSRWLGYHSNIPIFDLESGTFFSDLNKYLTNGDYSGAVNSDYINDSKRQESSSVEMPLNFKVTSGMSTGISSAYSIDEDITCHWSQSVDTSEYEYEYQCRVTVEQVKTSGKNDYNQKEFNSGWVKFGNAAYNGADTINLKIEAKQMDNLVTKIMLASQETDNPLRYKGYLVTRIELRIRNIDRASSDNACSRWVCFTTTRGGSYSNSGKPDKVTVEDDAGNDFSEDSDYTKDYDPIDRNNISNVSSFKGNITYFLNLIRNGFGFTGNHGLISLFSAWFSWLPSGFVSIVMVGFGLIIFVAVVRIVLNFLT